MNDRSDAERLFLLYDDGQGGMAVIEDEELRRDVMALAQRLLPSASESAAVALMERHAQQNLAPEYLELLVAHIIRLVSHYAMVAAKPLDIPLIFRNIHSLIIRYRMMRSETVPNPTT